MSKPSHPSEIAREAIRLLALRRLSPTPEHFQRAYNEVAGRETAEPGRPPKAESQGELHWANVLRGLLKQWDARQKGLTQTRKGEMLERVLINFGSQDALLAEKLQGLTRSWANSGEAATVLDESEVEPAPEAEDGPPEPLHQPAMHPFSQSVSQPGMPEATQIVATLVEHLQQLADSCEPYWPDLCQQAQALARELAGARAMAPAQFEAWSRLWREMLMRAEDSQVLCLGLKRLMALLFQNIGELVGDEAWLSGQLAAMQNLMRADLQADTLLEAERSLRELAHKQGAIKESLDEAKGRLKTLITTFVDHVGEMSRNAEGYQARIGSYSARISQASDIGELGDVVQGLSSDVTALRDALRRSHDELEMARSEAEQARLRIQTLEQDLMQVSSLVREDQLTGALNRRGMDEALARELTRSQRMRTRLSLGLLDIDHFKKLNDSLGHQAGDEALRHLAAVVRTLLRPTDILARYGGEEFLVLLPNTSREDAAIVLRRMQRALTKKFFLHDNERLLITFSAGVVERKAEDNAGDLIARADAAMYRAKQSGRNRVEMA